MALPRSTPSRIYAVTFEQPAPADAPPESDEYETIAQFYAAVEAGIRGLCDELGEDAVFSGDPDRQVGEFHLRNGGGAVIPVHDPKSALAALTEIVEQGEGASPTAVWDGHGDEVARPSGSQRDPRCPATAQQHLLPAALPAGGALVDARRRALFHIAGTLAGTWSLLRRWPPPPSDGGAGMSAEDGVGRERKLAWNEDWAATVAGLVLLVLVLTGTVPGWLVP